MFQKSLNSYAPAHELSVTLNPNDERQLEENTIYDDDDSSGVQITVEIKKTWFRRFYEALKKIANKINSF